MEERRREVVFDQDRLDVYWLARRCAREIEALVNRLPRSQYDHADQLRRAVSSIALNTAEGAGEFRPREKARFYRMARRSATEAAAVLDSLVDRRMLAETDIAQARRTLHRVVGGLTNLILACDPDRKPRRSAKEP